MAPSLNFQSTTGGTWTYHLVYTFCSRTNCGDGSAPAGISLDSQRNLYGATYNGGKVPCPAASNGCGTIFKLVHGTGETAGIPSLAYLLYKEPVHRWSISLGCSTLQADGTLYGPTLVGGKTNQGTLFKLVQTSGAWVLTSLYSFCVHCSLALVD